MRDGGRKAIDVVISMSTLNEKVPQLLWLVFSLGGSALAQLHKHLLTTWYAEPSVSGPTDENLKINVVLITFVPDFNLKKNKLNSTKTRTHDPRISKHPASGWCREPLSLHYTVPHSPQACLFPAPVLEHRSSLIITHPHHGQIVMFPKWENYIFRLCLNPRAAQPKSNKQTAIIKSKKCMAQMNVFLKRDQTLELKELETIIEKHLYLVPSETVCQQLSFIWAAFIFPTVGGNGAETMRGDSLVTLKWASKLHGSLTPAPAALGWLLYQRQKSSHNCLSLWICWLSGKCWCAGCPRCSPHEPHFAIESTELHWSGERFWNELFLYSRSVWNASLMYTWCLSYTF